MNTTRFYLETKETTKELEMWFSETYRESGKTLEEVQLLYKHYRLD